MTDTPRFSVSNAFSGGWWALKQRYWLLVLGVVMCLTAEVVRMGVSGAVGGIVSHDEHSTIASWVSALLALFLTFPLWIGLVYTAARAVRGLPTGSADLLCGFSRYREVVSTVLAVGLALMVAYIVGVVSVAIVGSAFGPLVILPAIVFAAAMLSLIVVLTPACVMAVDPQFANLGLADRLNASIDCTTPRTAALVGALLLVTLTAGATGLLAGIGLVLLGLPLAASVIATTYVMLTTPVAVKSPVEPLTPFPSVI